MYSVGVHVIGIRGGSHSVTSKNIAGGAAVRVLNLERESCEHLRWTHLEQVQHCTDLPCQVTFPVHRAGRDGPRVGMNITAHQEKETNEETKTGKRRAGEKKKRKQATDFEEAVCYPSVAVQEAA